MASKFYTISGEIRWAKRKLDDQYNNWSIQIAPDADGLKTIAEAQIEGKFKTEGDKRWFTFRRPESKEMKGVNVTFDPPKFMILKDGKPEEYEGIIGNGSTGFVKVVVYDTRVGKKGTRYEGVLVKDLIEYVAPETTQASAGASLPPPF